MGSKKELKQKIEEIKKARAGKVYNVINQGERFEGKLNLSSSIRIDGEVSGEINCEGLVILGKNAVVRGKVSAVEVIIAGNFEGEVETTGVLELEPTCHLKGDVKVRYLVIHEGAFFLGNTTMVTPDTEQNR
ncbi:MAG: polymer-forming cytoskeletal protein [Actinobacteria bacterium]|nr:polymer-forming cytoskeletal protein [Actinomycetota bacterium]